MTLLRLLARDLGVPPPSTREFAAALITAALVILGLIAGMALIAAVTG